MRLEELPIDHRIPLVAYLLKTIAFDIDRTEDPGKRREHAKQILALYDFADDLLALTKENKK